MSEFPVNIKISAFFDSIAKNYPYGVPRQRPKIERKVVAFVIEVASIEAFAASLEFELLNAAITKGLKLTLAECEIIPVQQGGSASLKDITATCVLICSEQGTNIIADLKSDNEVGAKYLNRSGKFFCNSRSLAAVVKDPALKRDLWSDIQQILKHLAQ